MEFAKRTYHPVPAEGTKECAAKGYRVCISELDRLDRNLQFVTAHQNSKADFGLANNVNATI